MSEFNLCGRYLHDLNAPGARNKDGRCRECNAAYHRAWRARHPEHVQAVARYKATPRGYLVNVLSDVRRRIVSRLNV